MMQDYRKRIGSSAILTGVIWATVNYIQGDLVFANVLLALTAVPVVWLTFLSRSRSGPHTSHLVAQGSAGANDVIVYWRPGCIHCDRLRVGLGSARDEVTWVNIFAEAEAGEFVAGYHGGNQTVPTAVTGSGELLAATPGAIRASLVMARQAD